VGEIVGRLWGDCGEIVSFCAPKLLKINLMSWGISAPLPGPLVSFKCPSLTAFPDIIPSTKVLTFFLSHPQSWAYPFIV